MRKQKDFLQFITMSNQLSSRYYLSLCFICIYYLVLPYGVINNEWINNRWKLYNFNSYSRSTLTFDWLIITPYVVTIKDWPNPNPSNFWLVNNYFPVTLYYICIRQRQQVQQKTTLIRKSEHAPFPAKRASEV